MATPTPARPVTRRASAVGRIIIAVVAAALLTTSLAVAFQRTEVREPCASYDPLRQPFFGETHLHTGLSFDASIRFVRLQPRDAYLFARRFAEMLEDSRPSIQGERAPSSSGRAPDF